MLAVYLFSLVGAVVVANPVFQRIPVPLSQTCPSQTCPAQTCPAHGFSATFPAACPTQTCSNQALPTQCQTCQNNPLQGMLSTLPVVVRPTNNNCPCSNPTPVQNQMINQPANQDALNQFMLSKILSPQLQTVLSPNNKVCNQCESQKPGVTPNVINNYIIIPPEYYKANETNANHDGNRVNQRMDNNSNRKRKQNRQTAQHGESESVYDLILGFLKARQNYGKIDPSELENYVEEKRQNSRSGKRSRSRKQKTDTPDCSCIEKEEPTNCPCDKKGEGRKLSSENTQIKAGSSRKKNPEYVKNLEEAIIRDFRVKNPTVPEEIARSLLANVISQIQNQGNLHYQPSSSPIGYGLYNSQPINPSYQISDKPPERERVQSGRRQRRPMKNKSERRNRKENTQGIKECEKCDQTMELNPTVLNIEKETITTEKITTTTENNINKHLPKKVSESRLETKKDLVDKLEQIKDKFAKLNEIETTTVNYNRLVESFPELGKEDKVPTFYDNGVEDYYPDFRADNIPYYATGEELDRYHYTTDRNGVTEGKRYVNFKHHKSFNDDNNEPIESPNLSDAYSEYTLPLPIEDGSFEESINNKDAEVQFHIPPFLELPDFETKQINKYYNSEEINDKFVADDTDKASVYSDSKTDGRVPENDLKPVKVFSKDKKGRTSIETILGHSKVVKYGRDMDDAGSTPAITYYLPEDAMTEDRIQLPDGDDAIVVAKSIHDLDDIWV